MGWTEGADEAIHAVVQAGLGPGVFLTRFVLACEFTDHSGRRKVAYNTDPESRLLDTLGLLDYVHTLAHAQVLSEVLSPDDGGDE